MANKYRLKYSKLEKMRFIGHLDLLNVFQRAIKRANLPIMFSQGFNPHQQMGFALPLPLGMDGLGEYMEMELKTEVATDIIARTLNERLPDGLTITAVRPFKNGEKTGAALTEAAEYEIALPPLQADISEAIENLLAKKEIFVMKKTKTMLAEVNIRPDIYSAEWLGDKKAIKATLSAGSSHYLKPELFMDSLYRQVGIEYLPTKTKYTRIDLLQKTDTGFKSLYL